MPAHQESQLLPFTPHQLFELVIDVERYPEFLPWCRAVRVVERGEGYFVAEMMVAFHHIRERYTSRVDFQPAQSIDVTLVQGPFKHLENHWRFAPAKGGTRMEFSLEFAFRNMLLESLMGGVFQRAQSRMMEAFRARANQLYGMSSC